MIVTSHRDPVLRAVTLTRWIGKAAAHLGELMDEDEFAFVLAELGEALLDLRGVMRDIGWL